MRVKSVLLVMIAFLTFGCQEEKQARLFTEMASEDEQNLISFTRANLDINLFNEDFNMLYLVLRDCYCVVENIEFVKEQINTRSNLVDPLVLLIKPDDYDPTYLKEILEMQKEFPQGLSLYVDYDDKFMEHGNMYVVDHLFAYRDGRFNRLMKVERDTYENVAEILQ